MPHLETYIIHPKGEPTVKHYNLLDGKIVPPSGLADPSPRFVDDLNAYYFSQNKRRMTECGLHDPSISDKPIILYHFSFQKPQTGAQILATGQAAGLFSAQAKLDCSDVPAS